MTKNMYYGRGTVYVEEPEDFTDIIDNPFYPGTVYMKGSWILHMLRHIVGDSTFFHILQTYYASEELRYGSATSEDFKEICEQVSGMNLDRFFYQWLYEEYFPRYSFSWSAVSNVEDYDLHLEIRQEQNNAFFWMPLDITVTTAEGETTFVVLDSLEFQTFDLTVPSEPLDVELDRDNWVMKIVQEPLTNPIFDEGILLVNGISWDDYRFEVRQAYENKAFWGDFSVDFWDCFNPPSGGYPETLPDPLGTGRVPDNVLGKYSTVIWAGNDLRGDLGYWQQTSIQSYLDAGGNVILITRKGKAFLNYGKDGYLGVRLDTLYYPILNCRSSHEKLTDMEFLAEQTEITLFDTTLAGEESTLLFESVDYSGKTWGLGVWKKPLDGGSLRAEGGQFVFISGRPYRYQWDQLRSNIEVILSDFFSEGGTSHSETAVRSDLSFRLDQNYPNPFNSATSIGFECSRHTRVMIRIFNLLGQEIETLLDTEVSAGRHTVIWDGKDMMGHDVPGGVYFIMLRSGPFVSRRKLILIR